MSDPSRTLLEAGAVASVAAVLMKLLPPISVMVAIAYYGFQIWEHPIGQRWRARWRRLLWDGGLTDEDRVLFAFLALGGTGVFLGLVALSRVVG